MHDTGPLLADTDFPPIKRGQLQTLQANLGYLCNLSCTHCHVNAGPRRTELMDKATIDQMLTFMEKHSIQCLDLTGGAPEMNPHFRYLVDAARTMGVAVIDRCNLTILREPGYLDLAEFLTQQKVIITASLPCYSADNVEQQRGKGVYELSIEALKQLNELGYGRDPELQLNLVYNPNGHFLPPAQEALEADYKRELMQRHGIVFNSLLTITNMPISRFGSMLISKGLYDGYMKLLKDNYADENLAGVMCKSLISIDWQGYVYDCDFNQMLDWSMHIPHSCSSSNTELPGTGSLITGSLITIASDRQKTHLRDIMDRNLEGNSIVIGEHCYGCTAGQGSSCSGALG